ncbi:MAG: carboxypeptidase regulatory-like domain-containing protein, partial [Gemmatimonadota bacterium]
MNSRLCSSLTRASAVLAAALLLAVPGLDAQQTGTVTGRVTDSQGGAPIASVQIFIEDLNLGALTQQNGRYLLVNVPAGTHTVTAARIGYRTVTQE